MFRICGLGFRVWGFRGLGFRGFKFRVHVEVRGCISNSTL